MLIEDVNMDKSGEINKTLANYNVNEVSFIRVSLHTVRESWEVRLQCSL